MHLLLQRNPSPSFFLQPLRPSLLAGALALGMALGGGASFAADQPGKGIQVQPVKSSVAEELFQHIVVFKALEALGYEVLPYKEVDYPTAYMSIANGDATFIATHWNPLHADYYKNAGGDAKLFREGIFSPNAAQGYLIDKKTADEYKITNIGQLKDPKLAQLFDSDGDGKADLTGCNPGWGCEGVIEHQLTAFDLRKTVTHQQGNYSALIADTVARHNAGKPVFYYTWTPYWVSNVMKPGKDVVWLEVPFSSLPGEGKGTDTRLPNGKNYGFTVNNQQIVANKAWCEANPAAARLFAIMQIPLADINAENYLMSQGEAKPADIQRHAEQWIKANQKTVDGWLAQARAAAQ
ncbi:glycine betaine/L-proline ABC transporter substrate-binding protein ProX [Comamonas badia]|uniref:glycine betaine/L-proline ABC transporter substrate-binding protein ProX n=1 Tax=Comamonas badia TaxID=265291 RepID=UPI00041FDC8A